MEPLAPHEELFAEVHCVTEVRVPVPHEQREALTHFYAELLSLAPWPAAEQIPGGIGFGDPRCGLYLQYRHDPVIDPMRRRLTLTVTSLDTAARRLEEREWPFARYRGFSFTDQWILVNDPAGHLIELRQLQNLM
ncbi:MAG: hypothetical protein PVJ57_07840 [Phycisphaerae bacterium]|jgi:hypothetical protein